MVDLDYRVSHISTIKMFMAIFSIIFNVYATNIMKSVPQMVNFAKLLHFATYATLTDMIVSFWICGQTHQRSDEIHELLDELSANSLSDYEYNEWLKFKIIDRKTRIGFTIGGFVPIKCTSLLAVILIFILLDHFILSCGKCFLCSS